MIECAEGAYFTFTCFVHRRFSRVVACI